MQPPVIPVKQTAAHIRAALARAFPDTAFRVRMDSHPGAIGVYWVAGGPTTSAVEAATAPYANLAWLCWDDSAIPAPAGSAPPHRGAQRVQFAADRVICQQVDAETFDRWPARGPAKRQRQR
jgi:hypothetical protein